MWKVPKTTPGRQNSRSADVATREERWTSKLADAPALKIRIRVRHFWSQTHEDHHFIVADSVLLLVIVESSTRVAPRYVCSSSVGGISVISLITEKQMVGTIGGHSSGLRRKTRYLERVVYGFLFSRELQGTSRLPSSGVINPT